MGIRKPLALIGSLVFLATLAYPAAKRDWKQGTLASVDMPNSEHRYECVVSDRVFLYTMEFEHPIKTPVHTSLKFVIQEDTFVLLDADGRERSAHIEKRERVFMDSDNLR
ncbi:MAG TPA: hypothetical protein VGP62_06745 [Bryobacteraceae bacterium]|nr:hypothetical protein [Bryobacteraceae bacterium]